MEIGESFVGEGAEAAHINTVLGSRKGPVGVAWASALASPSEGHVPFVAVVRPGVPTRPLTLFINKAILSGDRHAELTWGAAQAGVAAGMADAVQEGVLTAEEAETWVCVAAVWVNPSARDAHAVYRNNRQAAREAIAAGRRGAPSLEAVLEAAKRPENPFFRLE